jgi:hypothetical protein
MFASAFSGQSEIYEVPALRVEVFLDKLFSLILVNGPHTFPNANDNTFAKMRELERASVVVLL